MVDRQAELEAYTAYTSVHTLISETSFFILFVSAIDPHPTGHCHHRCLQDGTRGGPALNSEPSHGQTPPDLIEEELSAKRRGAASMAFPSKRLTDGTATRPCEGDLSSLLSVNTSPLTSTTSTTRQAIISCPTTARTIESTAFDLVLTVTVSSGYAPSREGGSQTGQRGSRGSPESRCNCVAPPSTAMRSDVLTRHIGRPLSAEVRAPHYFPAFALTRSACW